MAVTHATVLRDILANAAVDSLDVGTTDLNGDLVIRTSGDVEIATLALTDPAFGASSSGTATAATITDDTNATGGTAAKFTLNDRDNVDKILGSVTATSGGGDIELSSIVIGATDTVSISSLTYTAPV